MQKTYKEAGRAITPDIYGNSKSLQIQRPKSHMMANRQNRGKVLKGLPISPKYRKDCNNDYQKPQSSHQDSINNS